MNACATNSRRSRESALMERILEVRYTDLNEEKELCKQLMDLAEPMQDHFEFAFANAYMLDSMLALGEYEECDFYLFRAASLCREYGYDDLMLLLANSAGLYYIKFNNEQLALSYMLEGLKLARRMQNYDWESKLLSNIGMAFTARGDWTSAVPYFRQAYAVVEPHIRPNSSGNAISYLSNLAESSQAIGDLESSERALTLCEGFTDAGPYHQLRLKCGWASHYAMSHDSARCVQIVDSLIEMGLPEFENRFFSCDMCISLLDTLLKIGDQARAKRLLDVLEALRERVALATRYQIQCLKIRYLELYPSAGDLNDAYRDHYEIWLNLSDVEDAASVHSMISRIQLNAVTLERMVMHRENQALENITRIDELTGLYNRRYFNKLTIKYAQEQSARTLGIVMLDLDYFKEYNDFYGHFEGDAALKLVANVLTSRAIEGIYACRYGGDEFICLCVDLSEDMMEDYVTSIKRSLADMAVPHQRSRCSDRLTLSIGYCNEPADAKDLLPERLLTLADEALYLAKQRGRNGSMKKRLP